MHKPATKLLAEFRRAVARARSAERALIDSPDYRQLPRAVRDRIVRVSARLEAAQEELILAASDADRAVRESVRRKPAPLVPPAKVGG